LNLFGNYPPQQNLLIVEMLLVNGLNLLKYLTIKIEGLRSLERSIQPILFLMKQIFVQLKEMPKKKKICDEMKKIGGMTILKQNKFF